MNKGIILLTKANSKEEAQDIVEKFLEKHKGTVWTPYYRIGGMYSCVLSEYKGEFLKICEKKFADENKKISYTTMYENKKEIQKIWEDLGAKGNNPLKVEVDSSLMNKEYDIMPLSDCIKQVKKYIRPFSEITKHLNEFSELYQEFVAERFCSVCDIYNISTENYEIPKDYLYTYYAVVVDIHC